MPERRTAIFDDSVGSGNLGVQYESSPYVRPNAPLMICNLVRTHTSIPVPRALDWDGNMGNFVGAEFIILEKIPGVPLSQKWASISDVDRYAIIEKVVKFEKELADCRFPAYGSLYFRQAIPDTFRSQNLSPSMDPSKQYCVGPSCHRSWWKPG